MNALILAIVATLSLRLLPEGVKAKIHTIVADLVLSRLAFLLLLLGGALCLLIGFVDYAMGAAVIVALCLRRNGDRGAEVSTVTTMLLALTLFLVPMWWTTAPFDVVFNGIIGALVITLFLKAIVSVSDIGASHTPVGWNEVKSILYRSGLLFLVAFVVNAPSGALSNPMIWFWPMVVAIVVMGVKIARNSTPQGSKGPKQNGKGRGQDDDFLLWSRDSQFYLFPLGGREDE